LHWICIYELVWDFPFYGWLFQKFYSLSDAKTSHMPQEVEDGVSNPKSIQEKI
ncbi:Hypothetical predicted protein, partial [Olea europaea subsp. europaea]